MLSVPADAPGLHFTRIETRVVSHERQFAVHFDDVRVPADARIGPEGDGLKAAFAGLNPERIVVAGMCTGLTRFALKAASSYANDRRVWRTSIRSEERSVGKEGVSKCRSRWWPDR